MYDYLSTVSFCLEPLERSAFASFLDAELDDEQSEDFKTVLRWANKCVRESRSFKTPLLAYLQEEEEYGGGRRRQQGDRELFDTSEDESELETEDSCPTPLMLAMNASRGQADWDQVHDILYEGKDPRWRRKLKWTWPPSAPGVPAGYNILHLACNKVNGDASWVEKMLCKICKQAIQMGIINQPLQNGQTSLHLAINYFNQPFLRALSTAEQQLIAQRKVHEAYLVDWALRDRKGLTPIGKFLENNEHRGNKEKTGPMMQFLQARLKEMGWRQSDIDEHLEAQRSLNKRLSKTRPVDWQAAMDPALHREQAAERQAKRKGQGQVRRDSSTQRRRREERARRDSPPQRPRREERAPSAFSRGGAGASSGVSWGGAGWSDDGWSGAGWSGARGGQGEGKGGRRSWMS